MTRVEKTFKKEFNKIKDEEFKNCLLEMLEDIPDYVLDIPSSSTGKYHPRDEVSDAEKSDGMIRHIKRIIILGGEILRMSDDYIKPRDMDLIIGAAIFHDIYKSGEKQGKYTVKTHPCIIYDKIISFSDNKYGKKSDEITDIKNMLYDLSYMCLFHEGRWTIPASHARKNKQELTPDQKRLCKLMHLLDYIVSRRSVSDMFQFDFMDDTPLFKE